MVYSEDSEMVERLYISLLRIRLLEERVVAVYDTDKIKSPVHLSIGQEAVSVGVCDVLKRDDIAFGTYRGHALYLAKGGNMPRMVAELYGKIDGCGSGKSGSMHLIDVEAGMMGTSAIVSSTIPQALGYAHALRIRRSDSIVVCFFGDAATEEGVFSETMNYAALKRLPILFVCENNNYAIFTPLDRRQPKNSSIKKRVESFGIPVQIIEDGDVMAIRSAATNAAEEIRQSGGPQFLECMTYRWKEHVGPGDDWNMGYRSRNEMKPWAENDQISVLGGRLTPQKRSELDLAVREEVECAFDYAEQSKFPNEIELLKHVLA
jgi:TPP-dependent pyruvate/acetoin dehydrogenase alpha subunit